MVYMPRPLVSELRLGAYVSISAIGTSALITWPFACGVTPCTFPRREFRSPITALPAINRPASDGDCLRLIDETTLEADISKDCSINFLFEELSRSGIEVLSMRNKTNRLEQLFVHLVENGAD